MILEQLAIAVSSVALLISAATAYWSFWRPVQIRMSASTDLFICNVLGGVPEAHLYIVFRALGASARTRAVQRIIMELRQENTDKHIQLEVLRDSKGEPLPFILTGGTSAAKDLRFEVNGYLCDDLDRVSVWSQVVMDMLPVEKRAQAGDLLENLRARAALAPAPEYSELCGTFAEIMSDVTPDRLERVLFITAGQYSARVIAYDDGGSEIGTKVLRFNVDEELAQTLRKKFNRTTRVRLVSDENRTSNKVRSVRGLLKA